MNSRISRKTRQQMFLLVSGGHINFVPLKGHQDGVFMQSPNLGKWIDSIRILLQSWDE